MKIFLKGPGGRRPAITDGPRTSGLSLAERQRQSESGRALEEQRRDIDLPTLTPHGRVGTRSVLHLAATETYYQLNIFGGMKWDSWSEEVKKKWGIPLNLGEPARKAFKGNGLDYYLDALHQVREKSLAEFRKRDDKWLATLVTEEDFSANNYAKWFHVAEHESDHDGQIKFLKRRLPGAKETSE